jgi:hypothetical protein
MFSWNTIFNKCGSMCVYVHSLSLKQNALIKELCGWKDLVICKGRHNVSSSSSSSSLQDVAREDHLVLKKLFI